MHWLCGEISETAPFGAQHLDSSEICGRDLFSRVHQYPTREWKLCWKLLSSVGVLLTNIFFALGSRPVLYRAQFPRRGLFPLVPPRSEGWRKRTFSKKLAPELLCSYHRGTAERAKVQNWFYFSEFYLRMHICCVFMSLLTQPTTAISIKKIYYICERLFI